MREQGGDEVMMQMMSINRRDDRQLLRFARFMWGMIGVFGSIFLTPDERLNTTFSGREDSHTKTESGKVGEKIRKSKPTNVRK